MVQSQSRPEPDWDAVVGNLNQQKQITTLMVSKSNTLEMVEIVFILLTISKVKLSGPIPVSSTVFCVFEIVEWQQKWNGLMDTNQNQQSAIKTKDNPLLGKVATISH